jgi:nitroreductase
LGDETVTHSLSDAVLGTRPRAAGDQDEQPNSAWGFDVAFARRYGSEAAEAPLGAFGHAANAVLENLLGHRSVRRYQDRALPEGTLQLLVAAAQSAASSANLQLWSVIHVEDPALRRALADVAGGQQHVVQAPLFLVWIADLHRAGELARTRGLGAEGLGYLESLLVAAVDTALAAQNAVVAAESLGLGTVYIGALRNQAERVAEILGLPSNAFAVFGLCVGWPDPEAPSAVKPRLPQRVVLHRDRYELGESSHAAVGGYDALMQGFYAAHSMAVPEGGWSWHSARRFATVAALNGRHVLREALQRLGFRMQ